MGALYTTNDALHYVSKRRGRKHFYLRSRKQFKLSQISGVEVVADKVVQYGKYKCIKLSPGLKISVGSDTTLLVAMHDAATFGSELVQVSAGKNTSLIISPRNIFS